MMCTAPSSELDNKKLESLISSSIECSLVVIYISIKTDVNINFKIKTVTLTRMRKSVNFIYFHVAYTFSVGSIRYTEVRRENICKDKIYLNCVDKK